MIINYFLYIALAAFCLVDHFQTKALIDVGYEEANPIVIWLIHGNWDNLLIFKIGMLFMLGILLGVHHLKREGPPLFSKRIARFKEKV